MTHTNKDPEILLETYKVGRNSWSFSLDGMQFAVVQGKMKARRVLEFLRSANLTGKCRLAVEEMVIEFRQDNHLMLSDPTPRR